MVESLATTNKVLSLAPCSHSQWRTEFSSEHWPELTTHFEQRFKCLVRTIEPHKSLGEIFSLESTRSPTGE